MTIICITHIYDGDEFIIGTNLADAAQKATEARVGKVTVSDVTPMGGTHYHISGRDAEPEDFWTAQLSHTMSDNEEWGWGETEAEARKHIHETHPSFGNTEVGSEVTCITKDDPGA